MTNDHPPSRERAAASSAGMGHRRRRPLLLGVAALAAVLWSTGTASSRPAHPSVVRAEVTAEGRASDRAVGWTVRRLAPGVYRIALPDDRVELDVPIWDQVADVTVLPLGRGANEVRFSLDGAPVDTAFGFVAVVRR